MTVLLSVATLAPAQAETFRFKSEVPQKQWSRTISGDLMTPRGKGPFPTVIVLHPCTGMPPMVRRSLTEHARHLTRHGFAVLMPDSFGPRGLSGGRACGGPLARSASILLLHDAYNAKAALAGHRKVDKDNIFITGQSLGAYAALMASLAKGSR